MLVLSRKTQESVVVGGAGGFERLLKVKVLGINRDKVRLGFEVDADIPVHRLGSMGTDPGRGQSIQNRRRQGNSMS